MSVSVGSSHACGVTTEGNLSCWGDPRNLMNADDVPEAASGAEFSSVSAAGWTTCAVTTTGTVLCWGDRPGSGDGVPFGEGVVPNQGSFTSVSAGERLTCGLKSDATLACWYDDLEAAPVPDGQFAAVEVASWNRNSWYGKGGTSACALRPRRERRLLGATGGSVGPSPGGTFTSVDIAVRDSICALGTDGTPVCWNHNNIDHFYENPPPTGIPSFRSAPEARTSAESRPMGPLQCWGESGKGMADAPSGSFQSVSAGYQYTCGLKTDGSVACWGENIQGTTEPPGASFVSIDAGGHHTCGITMDGLVLCWGREAHSGTPPDGSFQSISAGNDQTCGIRPDGSMVCWSAEGVGSSREAPSSPWVQGKTTTALLTSMAPPPAGAAMTWARSKLRVAPSCQ